MTTPAMLSALVCAAGQLVAGKTMPGTYSPNVTGGSSACRVDSLRALERRGLLTPVPDIVPAWALTSEGLRTIETKIRELCAEEAAKAEPLLDSPYPGRKALAVQALEGVDEILKALA